MHTVSLNDSDFDDSPKPGELPRGSNQARGIHTEKFPASSPLGVEQIDRSAKSGNEDADRVEVGLSDNEGIPGNKGASHVEEEEVVYYTPGSASAGVISKDGEEVLFKVSSKDKHEDLEESQSAPASPLNTSMKVLDNDADNKRFSRLDSGKLSVDSEEDERAEDDDEHSPQRDLFSAHFDKLASDLKVRILRILRIASDRCCLSQPLTAHVCNLVNESSMPLGLHDCMDLLQNVEVDTYGRQCACRCQRNDIS